MRKLQQQNLKQHRSQVESSRVCGCIGERQQEKWNSCVCVRGRERGENVGRSRRAAAAAAGAANLLLLLSCDEERERDGTRLVQSCVGRKSDCGNDI